MKRILSFVLVLILTLVPMSVCAKKVTEGAQAQVQSTDDISGIPAVAAETGYTPRLTAPSKSNGFYYSNKNIFYSIGYGMPNCTAYAWGRAYELLGTAPKLSVDSAHYWWNYNKSHNYYPSGQTPKLGAIACWNNPYGGHVAVVEKITDTTVTLSHSEWAGRTFYLTEFPVGDKNGGIYSSGWSFYGYIYILDGEILPEGDVYRVDSSNGLNLRKGAGTSYSLLTAIPNQTEIVVKETKKADGYTWGKTTYAGYTGWCVLDFCELIFELPEPEPEPPAEEPPMFSPAPPSADDIPSTNLPDFSTPPEQKPEVPPVSSGDEGLPSTPDTAPLPDSSSDDENKVIWADVNGDGKVTIADVTALQKHLAGMEVGIILKNADVNCDGKVTVADATYIQKVLAGITSKKSADTNNSDFI
ncbi:MAG: CHAP domain-containing protein [Ruminococcaceae bacterium]|nr:CHAP domain-containing protein [Oscillospiraceae bacterium]